jgi:hypothetical protein
MSNKKLATAKKAQQKLMKEKRDLQPTHIGQLMQLFEDREYIMTPPHNFKFVLLYDQLYLMNNNANIFISLYITIIGF